MSEIRLGSLFDGIGVFPLAAVRCGIVPAWASEIEKAPSVTMALQPMVARATSFVITIEDIAIIFGALLAIDIVCLFIGNRRNRDVI